METVEGKSERDETTDSATRVPMVAAAECRYGDWERGASSGQSPGTETAIPSCLESIIALGKKKDMFCFWDEKFFLLGKRFCNLLTHSALGQCLFSRGRHDRPLLQSTSARLGFLFRSSRSLLARSLHSRLHR